MRIALLTSRSTAALQDILKILRRFPWISLSLFHAPVQGDGSAEIIADAISRLNKTAIADLIILARGGGSLEDLWEFNEEIVARAIVASRIPIVTGIGHEVDTSIADLVADYHAHADRGGPGCHSALEIGERADGSGGRSAAAGAAKCGARFAAAVDRGLSARIFSPPDRSDQSASTIFG